MEHEIILIFKSQILSVSFLFWRSFIYMVNKCKKQTVFSFDHFFLHGHSSNQPWWRFNNPAFPGIHLWKFTYLFVSRNENPLNKKLNSSFFKKKIHIFKKLKRITSILVQICVCLLSHYLKSTKSDGFFLCFVS